MKLIKLKNKFILVSDEQPTDYYLDDTNAIRKVVTDDEYYWSVRKEYKKVISENLDFSLLSEEDCETIGFVDVEGFKTAQSLNDKMFSLKDMRNAYFSGGNFKDSKEFDYFIQSLQQTSWDCRS